MINIETIKLMKFIEEFKELSKREIIPFSQCHHRQTFELHIVYDEKQKNNNGTYKIPYEVHLQYDDHDIINTYNDLFDDNVVFGVKIDKDGNKCVSIEYENEEIIIDYGEWYFA